MRVENPDQPLSKHVVLCFSGFCSEKRFEIPNSKKWVNANQVLEPLGYSCFQVMWESVTKGDIARRIASNLGTFGFEMFLNGVGSAATLVGCIRLVLMAKEFAYDRIAKVFKDNFTKACKNAKLTG